MKTITTFMSRFKKKADHSCQKVVPVEELVVEPESDVEEEAKEQISPIPALLKVIPAMVMSTLKTVLTLSNMQHKLEDMVGFLADLSAPIPETITPEELCRKLVRTGHIPRDSLVLFLPPEAQKKHIIDLLPPSWSAFVVEPEKRPDGVKLWRGHLAETAEGCKLVIEPDRSVTPVPFDASVLPPATSPPSASDIRVSSHIIRAIQEQPLEVVACNASAIGVHDSGSDVRSDAVRDIALITLLDVPAPPKRVLTDEVNADEKLANWKLAANIGDDVSNGFEWLQDDAGACVAVTCSELQRSDLRRVAPVGDSIATTMDSNDNAGAHTSLFTKCVRKRKDVAMRRVQRVKKSWGAVIPSAKGRFESIPLKCLDPSHNGMTKRPVSLIRGRSARLQVTISRNEYYYLAHAFPHGHYVLFVALVPQGGRSGLLHARQGIREASLDVRTALNVCYLTTMSPAAHPDKQQWQGECFLWLPCATEAARSVTSCELKLCATNSIKKRDSTRTFQIGTSLPCAVISQGVTPHAQHTSVAILSWASIVMAPADFQCVDDHVRSGVPLRVARVPDAPMVARVVAVDQHVTVRWTKPSDQDFPLWHAFRVMCICCDDGGNDLLLIKTIWCPFGTIPGENCDVTCMNSCKVDFDLPSGRFRFRVQVIGDTMTPWSPPSDDCVRPTWDEQERLMNDVESCCSVITTMDDIEALATCLHDACRLAGLRRVQLEHGFASLCQALNTLLRATLQDNSGREDAILAAAEELQQRFSGDVDSIIISELVSKVTMKKKRAEAVCNLQHALGSRHFRWVRECVAVVRRHGYGVRAPRGGDDNCVLGRVSMSTAVCSTGDHAREVRLMLDTAVKEVLPRISALEALEDEPTEVTLKTIKEHLFPEDMTLLETKELYIQVHDRVLAMTRIGDLRRLEEALRIAHSVGIKAVSDVYFRLFAKHYMVRTQYAGQGGSPNLEDATWAIVMAKALCAPRMEVANAEKWMTLMKEQSALRSALYSKLGFTDRLEMAIADIEQPDGAAHAEDSGTAADVEKVEGQNEDGKVAADAEDLPEADKCEHDKVDSRIQVDEDKEDVVTRRIKDAFDERVLSAQRDMVEALKGGTEDDSLTAVLLAFSSCLKLKCHGEFQREVCGLAALRHLEDRVAERGNAEQLDEAIKLCEAAKVDKWKVDAMRNHLWNLGYARSDVARSNISRAILRDIVAVTAISPAPDAIEYGALTPSCASDFNQCITPALQLSDYDTLNVSFSPPSPSPSERVKPEKESIAYDSILPGASRESRKAMYDLEDLTTAQHSENLTRPPSRAETVGDADTKRSDRKLAPPATGDIEVVREGANDPQSDDAASIISTAVAHQRNAHAGQALEVSEKPLSSETSSSRPTLTRENKKARKSKHRGIPRRTAVKITDDEKMQAAAKEGEIGAKVGPAKEGEMGAKVAPAKGGDGGESGPSGGAVAPVAPVVRWSNLKTLESEIDMAVAQHDVIRTQALMAAAPRFLSVELRAKAQALLTLASTEEQLRYALQAASPGRVAYLKNKLPRTHPLRKTSTQLLATMAAEDALEEVLAAERGIDFQSLENAITAATRDAVHPERLNFASRVLQELKSAPPSRITRAT
eukprot:GEMP01000903.1.p1 GENE.GEMP01000903.1~~GEMP01000903.1.p1  ORF type:complete len:1609 (+),score=443.65 GEMP01000903.1:251-5077(+)